MAFTWTHDGKLDVDTIHRAGCAHTRMRRNRDEPIVLPVDTLDEAHRYMAESMGWDNWPDENPAEFRIDVAPCAR